MANELVGQCWLIDFPTPAFRLVMMKLCDCAEPDGTSIYPSVATIRRETGLAESVIRDALAAYQQATVVNVEGEGCGNRAGKTTVLREIDTDKLRLLTAKRRKGFTPTPSTHVLAQREVGVLPDVDTVFLSGAAFPSRIRASDKRRTIKVWAIFPREAIDADAPPESGGANDEGTPPDRGGAPLHEAEGHPSGQRSPPLPTSEGTPPDSGANPSFTPSIDPSPLPPRGSRRRGRAREIDDLILKIRTPERAQVIALLIEPVARTLKIDAPDPAFALGQVADWAADQPASVLVAAKARLFEGRKVTAKPSDIEDAVKAARKAVDIAAKLADAPVFFEGTESFRRAIAAVERVNPMEAAYLRGQSKVTRKQLARLGVTL